MKGVLVLAMVLLVLVLVTGCLAGPNDSTRVADEEGDVAGFWKGLW